MNKILPTFRYLLKGFTSLGVIAIFSILGNVAFTNLIYQLTDRYDGVHQVAAVTAPMDVTAGVFALLTGMLLFLANFKVALANGVSRKTFLLANLPAAAVFAAVLALFNGLVLLIHGLFWPIVLVTHLFYPGIHWTGILPLQFAQYFLLMVMGWFVTLAYYRSSVPVRWAISLAPFVLFGLYLAANAKTNGSVYAALTDFWLATMRPAGIAVISLLVYSAILSGLVYLLLRRAPLKG
jgi:hypothetical protein